MFYIHVQDTSSYCTIPHFCLILIANIQSELWFNALPSKQLSFKPQPILLRPIIAMPSYMFTEFWYVVFFSIGSFDYVATTFNSQSIFLILFSDSPF